MSESLDIAIIGAGIVGTLTALTLRAQAHRVTLIERDPDGLCCSTGNAGSISASSVAPVGMPGVWKQVPSMLMDPHGALSIQPRYALQVTPWLLAFLRASQPDRVQDIAAALHHLGSGAVQRYQQILQAAGAPELLTATGQLHVYTSEAARNKDAMGWQLRRQHGAPVQWMDNAALHSLEPDVGPQFTHGVFIPSDANIINPQRLLATLRAQFVAAGGTLLREAVTQLTPSGAQVQVHTRGQRLTFDKAVVTAGAWSSQLSAQLGDTLPLQTQRGYHVMIASSGVRIQRPVVAAEAKVFASPMEAGLRFAGTVEFAQLDKPPTPQRAQSLLRHGMRLFPGISADAAAGHTTWMGNRPCMPDSLPVIDHSSASRHIIYAFGHGHLGLTHAPATADMVAQLLHAPAPLAALQPYAAQRFRRGGASASAQ